MQTNIADEYKTFANKYPSIKNSYKISDVAFMRSMNCGEFVVSEKIHGANFGIVCTRSQNNSAEGGTLQINAFRRKGFLKKDENFYNYQIIMAEYEENICKLFEHVESRGTKKIIIYSELYGGGYPHPDVPQVDGFKMIQRGVVYSPNIHICAFDVMLDEEFMNICEMNDLLDKFKIPRVKILLRGTIDECLKYPNEFITTISGIHGLPELKDNICEGIVIKPIVTKFMNNGSRVILKNKNEHFREIHHEPSKKLRGKGIIKLSTAEEKVLEVIEAYITSNRFDNVVSKMLTIESMKDFPKIKKEMIDDVLDDFTEDNKDLWDDLPLKKKKKIPSRVGRIINNKIRPWFMDFLKQN